MFTKFVKLLHYEIWSSSTVFVKDYSNVKKLCDVIASPFTWSMCFVCLIFYYIIVTTCTSCSITATMYPIRSIY